MTQSLLRTDFNRSSLLRFLADLSIVDAAASKQTFAERLGQWLDVADAITLHGAHNASPASSSPTRPGMPSVGIAADEEFARVRTALVNSITASCSPSCGETRTGLRAPKPGAALEIAAAYEPYRRFYLAHQGAMELSVRPLRTSVRRALSTASARLGQLAALDEALDKILSVRERQLLSMIPLLLQRRFGQLLKAHQQALLDSRQADTPALRMRSEGWPTDFCRELQAVLLAELDFRLLPILGLIEALRNGANEQK